MQSNHSRYEQLFLDLEQRKEIAWIPFVMLGYPDMASSIRYIETFIDNGADALEIGIPFSDPVADGVLIQESARIALEQDTTVEQCLAELAKLRLNFPKIPIGLLIYANLVYSPGLNNFYKRCHVAGVDSVLIADIPLVESQPFITAANDNNVDAVFIAPPNASVKTIRALSVLQSGYTYVVSRPGVTGDNKDVEYPVQIVQRLLEYQAPPPVLGFGISQPDHVAKAVSYGFRGVISGTAITRIIRDNKDSLFKDLKAFSLSMKSATRYDY